MIGTDNIGYIAGLFDTQGCATCKQKKIKRKDRGGKIYNQWYIRCEITLSNKATIEWIHEVLGFGWCAEKRYNNKPKYKKQWRWCCGYRDALLFAKIIWPYTQIKLHQIENIIDHYEASKPDGKNVIDLESYRREHGKT